MNERRNICLETGNKMIIPAEIREQLGLKVDDTFELFIDEKNDKLFLIPERNRSSELIAFGSVSHDMDSSIRLPQSLCDVMSLCESQELSVGIDIVRHCIVIMPIAPLCLFCGALGDITYKGKHICPDCIDELTNKSF